MVCKHCGKEISDQSVFCPVCGGKVERIGNGAASQPLGTAGAGSAGGYGGLAANSLFVVFARERQNKGVLWEVILWCAICFAMLLSFVNIILLVCGKGASDWRGLSILLWIFTFLCEIGFCLFVGFRWHGFSVLYGIATFLFIILVPFYMAEVGVVGWYYGYDQIIFITICFALALITSLGLVICVSFEVFTKMKMKLVVFICSLVEMFFILCMAVIAYFPSGFRSISMGLSNNPYYLYILGSVSYLILCCVVTLYTAFYCRGVIEDDKGNLFHRKEKTGEKITETSQKEGQAGAVGQQPETAGQQALIGIQCIHGNYQGQAFPVQGEIIIGSQPGSAHIVLQDAYVSKQHCRIRFNAASDNYELIDLSTNGVYLENGVRLQGNMYHSCPRGTVVYLGSKNQKYKLL